MSRVRSAVAQWRWRMLLPVLLRLDTLDAGLGTASARLDEIDRRLERIERLIQATGARVATASEQSNGLAESEARMAGRVEEIERLLGAKTGDR